MKVYGITKVRRQTSGHGDTFEENLMTRQGPYNQGEFPPLFKTKSEAAQWLRQQNENHGDSDISELWLEE